VTIFQRNTVVLLYSSCEKERNDSVSNLTSAGKLTVVCFISVLAVLNIFLYKMAPGSLKTVLLVLPVLGSHSYIGLLLHEIYLCFKMYACKMCVCVCARAHTHVHVCIYLFIYLFIYVFTCVVEMM
jgi:hypothetical protein